MYRDWKNSNNEFRSTINTKIRNLHNANDTSLSSFINVCKETMDKVAPLKQKYMTVNNGPFMNKHITKAIMKQIKKGLRVVKD